MSSHKTALITGASRGIGQAIACRLAKADYQLALMASNIENLQETAELCRAQGAQVNTYGCDFKNELDSLPATIDQITSDFDQIHTFVCNHGMLWDANLMQHDTTDSWRDVIQVNLTASMYLTRLLLENMLQAKEDAAMIYISSMAATFSSKHSTPYCASKAALLNFAHSIFEEVREAGMKVTTICPGWVDTDMATRHGHLDINKMIQPQDIADTVIQVLTTPHNMCPVEIRIRPQCTP